MKIIFLDIDGVLNHRGNLEIYPIDKGCVKNLNIILQTTKANIVLSSAWRYMIMSGEMQLKGFEYMLRSHGVNCAKKLIGLTPPDDIIPERYEQVAFWLRNTKEEVDKFVILDDFEEFPNYPDNFVHTNWEIGLSLADAEKAIAILS
jgi:hypothetical protein